MADITALLNGLGVNPLAAGPQSASQVRPVATRTVAVRSKARKLKNPSLTQGAEGGFGTGRKIGTPAPVVTSVPISDTPHEDDSAWDIVKNFAEGAIKVVDTPRAYLASAADQLARVVADPFSSSDAHASWDDFTKNASEHVGFGTYLTGRQHGGSKDLATHPGSKADSTGIWGADNALGFFGDVALDPLTYVTPLATDALKGGDAALEAAVHAGGRNSIAKAVAEKAATEFPTTRVFEAGRDGLQEVLTRNIPKEVDALIADAGQRGRGALTRKGIERAGLTAEQEAALQIPKLGVSVLGKTVPGSSIVADAIENAKGSVKAWAGASKAGAFARDLKTTEAWGQNALIDTIRDGTASTEVRAKAVQALKTANQAQADSYGWLTRKSKELFHGDSELSKILKDSTEADHMSWIDNIESGSTQLSRPEQVLKDFFESTHSELTNEFGVKVPYRENYIPHIVTREASKLAEKDESVKKFITDLATKEGFQKARSGTETITQANAKFVTEHGVKLFVTDPKDIVQRYMFDATDAIGRTTQAKMLTEMGLAEVIPEIRKVADLAEKDIARLGRRATRAEGRAMRNVNKVIDTREEQAQIAATALKERKAAGLAEADRVTREVADLGRQATKAQKTLDRTQALLSSQEDALAQHTATVKALRGGAGSPMQTEARAQIKRITGLIEKSKKDLAEAQTKVAYVMNNFQSPLGERVAASKGFAAETKRLAAYHTELMADVSDADTYLQGLKLKNTAPGDGTTLADMSVKEATANVADLTASKDAAEIAVRAATDVHSIAVAELPVVLKMVDDSTKEINSALHDIIKSKNPVKLAKRAEYARDIQDSLVGARKILSETSDPAAAILARMDVAAAVHDVAAQSYMSEVNNAHHWIDVLNDEKFRDYMKQKVSKGWERINDTHQIPGWMNDALKAESMLNDADMWRDAWKFHDKALNTMKGYLIARPAFVIRNAYASLFNVYLEAGAGAAESVGKYMRFARMMDRSPETYMEEATAKWGRDTAERLEQARTAAAATGAGQAGDEVAHGMIGGLSHNPLNPNFAPVALTRRASERVEFLVRGGHAFDVLERGGSLDLAVDTVNKWHFNYRDITNFDRGAKRVMPFWTFFSRNMALQMETWPEILPRLNRSYFNLQRNLSLNESPDSNVPDYYRTASGIRLPGGDATSAVSYLFPDVSPNQFVSDVSSAVSSKGKSLLGQVNPFLKVPAELAAGKQYFNDSKFQGWNKPRDVPFYVDGPIQTALEGLGLVKPGGTSGDPQWTDTEQYITESALPTLGQGSRMERADGWDGLLSWLGVSVKTNTPAMRKAKLKADKYASNDRKRRDKALAGS